MQSAPARRYPIGAEPAFDGVHFRVWAPERRRVAVVIGDVSHPLDPEEQGYFSGLVASARPGTRYRFALDDDGAFPDPASRFQPEGPHGPSEVIDATTFRWTDEKWRGPVVERQVLYELHVGAYTRAGTFRALIDELDELAELGVTCLELMPLADFPGEFGWGYDGVNVFSPTRLYGRPDDLRALVDAAHARGLSVILDVVYNHLGPDGNHLSSYAHDYVSRRYENEWGEALNFDGDNSGPVRELFVSNARYWIEEFHFDGLRIDATQSMHDASTTHLLTEVASAVRAAGGERRTLLIAENEPQHACLVRPVSAGGYGLDMIWNDDFHHSARVAVTGRDEGYYTDYGGTPQELISAAKYGFLFQGQHYRWQGKRRGRPALGLEPWRRVVYIQNHDQIANSATGARLHRLTSPGRLRAITALTLLMPGTPMIFMGQEFAASSPFLFFADHSGELAAAVRKGRRDFLAQFPTIATDESRRRLDAPDSQATFEASRLDLADRERNREVYALHRDLLRLRREDPAFAAGRCDGAVLSTEALCLRFFHDAGDRLLLLNLGRELHLEKVAEPLLAPPEGQGFRVLWSSESVEYGGLGTAPIERTPAPVDAASFVLPPHAAVVLQPGPIEETKTGSPDHE